MAKLSDLKALIDAKRASEPPAPKAPAAPAAKPAAPHAPTVAPRRAIAATKHAEGDVDLKAAFADVSPIKPVNRARIAAPDPAPVPRHRLADERDALEASKYGDDPAPQSWDIGQEHEGEQTFLRAGLGTDVLGKLRRGHWKVQAELDLHGHDSEEAHDALADFLVDARSSGMRCVRVIHGKGLNSPDGVPTIKNLVDRVLRQRSDVLAFHSAPPAQGGTGAVLVLLASRR